MTITIQNIAKGVPPRLHEPKFKSKSQKRVRSDSSDSLEDSPQKPKVKKKKKKWPRKEVKTESEVEEVEDAGLPVQEVEEVNTIQVSDEAELLNEEEVSIHSSDTLAQLTEFRMIIGWRSHSTSMRL